MLALLVGKLLKTFDVLDFRILLSFGRRSAYFNIDQKQILLISIFFGDFCIHASYSITGMPGRANVCSGLPWVLVLASSGSPGCVSKSIGTDMCGKRFLFSLSLNQREMKASVNGICSRHTKKSISLSQRIVSAVHEEQLRGWAARDLTKRLEHWWNHTALHYDPWRGAFLFCPALMKTGDLRGVF